MYINKLELESYRRFSAFSIEFDRDITVIAARNGQGKTTVLDALASALGPFVGAFDEGRGQHLLRTDAHRRVVGRWPSNEPSYPVVVAASLEKVDCSTIEWSRRLNSGKKGAKTTIREAAPLAQWGKSLQEAVRQGREVTLPVVAYYSSRRLSLSQKNYGVRNEDILAQSRTAAYSECLTSGVSSFAQLELWVARSTLAMLQARDVDQTEDNFRSLLLGVAGPIAVAMRDEGWVDFRYSVALGELSMTHRDHGELPITMLSDGVRAVISLVADLALRCVRLNPMEGAQAPSKTPGVVLIDEVDLHLHPAWQQRIIRSLREAFPLVQFVLTTHSPQVLSTVGSDQIRIVDRDQDGNWGARSPESEVKGLESSVALSDVMHVSPTPDLEESRLIRRYTELIELGAMESTEAAEVRLRLASFYGESHPVLIDANRLIRFRQLRERVERKRQGDDGGRD
ncbi:ATP-binding protein [Clavibacter michiganensis]|nr:ATP-binding protein [Clavibacter michiganensis]